MYEPSVGTKLLSVIAKSGHPYSGVPRMYSYRILLPAPHREEHLPADTCTRYALLFSTNIRCFVFDENHGLLYVKLGRNV